jgi:hypothetical protein
MSPNLLESVEERYGVKTAVAVGKVFNELQLPVPDEGEFVEAAEKGYIVPITPYGVNVRLTPVEKRAVFNSRHILQPLASRPADLLHVDVQPGVATNKNMRDTRRISEKMRAEGIEYYDSFPPTLNTGWMPYKTDEFPDGFPVVFDPDACRRLNGDAKDVKGIVTKTEENPQDVFYGDLRVKLEDAWSANEAEPGSGDMTGFWDMCVEKKEEGVLLSSWAEKQFRSLGAASQKYAVHLKASRGTASVLPSADDGLPLPDPDPNSRQPSG